MASALPSSSRMLAIYLRHHAAASRGGLDLFERSARSQLDAEVRRELRVLTSEVAQDRDRLLDVLRRLGVSRPKVAEVLVGVAETVGRLKPNGTLVRRSPLSDLMELEALSAAVEAKRLGWVTLRIASDHDHRLDGAELDRLIDRARDQRDRLEGHRRGAIARVLAGVGVAR